MAVIDTDPAGRPHCPPNSVFYRNCNCRWNAQDRLREQEMPPSSPPAAACPHRLTAACPTGTIPFGICRTSPASSGHWAVALHQRLLVSRQSDLHLVAPPPAFGVDLQLLPPLVSRALANAPLFDPVGEQQAIGWGLQYIRVHRYPAGGAEGASGICRSPFGAPLALLRTKQQFRKRTLAATEFFSSHSDP